MMKILCLGDVVGREGRNALKKMVPTLKQEQGINLVIANSENASGGLGLDKTGAEELIGAGVDLITLGDHTWKFKDLVPVLESGTSCIRPANYADPAPGKGWARIRKDNIEIGVFNVMGRTFINGALDCPFQKVDEILGGPLKGCAIIIGDIHAEATSEKYAMARHLDGRVSLLFGTHTHVQTSDAQILPAGTAYISDLGMCGVIDGVLGMDSKTALKRFQTGMPAAYRLAEGRVQINGIIAEIESDGRAKSISLLSKSVLNG